MTRSVGRDQIVRYRARVSHLDEKLAPGSVAQAAWGGLQDSVPRAGVVSLHARVAGTRPDSWEDPSLVQIWFRGGADYLVPRADVGIFTLGSYPRDPDAAAHLERLADAIDRVAAGRTLLVRDLSAQLALDHPTRIRTVAVTGRAHIRWDAANIWLIPAERPELDVEDARRELARRFVHWFGPTTVKRLATWTGVAPRDARETWASIAGDLTPVDVEGEERLMLAADLAELERGEPVRGVRLVPFDDPFTKLDADLLVRDETRRFRVFPPTGQGVGHIPGAVLVDGEVVGSWQRQQRKVTIHPWAAPSAEVREAIEWEALAFPIASPAKAGVSWE
jgi:hypothetical protein